MRPAQNRVQARLFGEAFIYDGLVKSLILDGAVKSSRSRLAQFRRMQRS